MNIIRNLFLFLGAVFALLLIIIGVVGYLVTGPAPMGAGATPVEVTDEAAESFDQKAEGLVQEIEQSHPGEEVALAITEEEATSKLAELAAADQLPLEMNRFQIHFDEGMVGAFAIVDLGIDMQVALQAKIEAEDGKPKITIESLNFGRLPIPRTLVDQVMIAIMKQLGERWESVPMELQDITIEDGKLTIIGVTK
ncbi:MAG: hypothetical protein ACE5IE_01255 [Dehalococcoidia bacterium]